MKKSVCIEKIFLEHEFYDRFARVREEGFSFVEFWNWESRDLPRIKALCADNGLVVASMSGDKRYSAIVPGDRVAYLEYLSRSLEAARYLGCHQLVLHSNAIDADGRISDPGTGVSAVTKAASLTRTLLEAAPLAEREGITLLLEPLNTFTQPGTFLLRTKDAADLVRVVASPAVKVLYDIWHMQQMEGNLVNNIVSCADVIGYVHIADAPDRHEPGTGEINFARITQALIEIKYDGIVGFELVPSSNSVEACKAMRAF